MHQCAMRCPNMIEHGDFCSHHVFGSGKCYAITKRGVPCPIDSLPGETLCHVHHPDATYQQQQRAKRAKKAQKRSRTEQEGATSDVRDLLNVTPPWE